MSATMIDNWTLEHAFVHANHFDIEDTPWQTLLMAIVLWDELWYYDNETSVNWKEQSHYISDTLSNILYPIEKSIIDVVTIPVVKNTLLDWNYQKSDESLIMHRTTFYVILSSCLGINLFIHPERETFISNLPKHFDRMDIFRMLDKKLVEYYEYINKELGKNLFSFNHPLLYDFIRQNSNNKCDELNAALSLRNDKDLISFKSMIVEIEHDVNNGSTQTLLTQIERISNAAKEITNKYNKKTKVGEIKLSFTPSFSKAIPITLNRNRNLKIHTTFIKKIANFGVEERLSINRAKPN